MPPDKPIRPGLLAPPAILISRALHLVVAWLLLATLGANWWCPVRAIEQGDPIEEGHLTQLLDFLANLNLDLYFDLGRSTIRAAPLLVILVTAYGAGFSSALLRFVPPLLAAETFDLPRVAIHKDRLLYRSVGAGDEWCKFGSGMGRGVKGSFQLILYEFVEVGSFDPDHRTGQFLLGDGVLLHDSIQLVLYVPAQLIQCVPEFHLTSEAVDLPDYAGVGHVCDRLVDQELLGSAPSELPPLGRGHGGVVVGVSANVDGDGVLGVASAVSSSDIRIVGVILYVLGDLGAVFVVPFPEPGIWDVDGVEVAAFKLIVNEACRWSVGIFDHTFVVDAANRVFLDWKRADSQLWSDWLVRGVVGWGVDWNRGDGGSGGLWRRCWLDKLSKTSRRHNVDGRMVGMM